MPETHPGNPADVKREWARRHGVSIEDAVAHKGGKPPEARQAEAG